MRIKSGENFSWQYRVSVYQVSELIFAKGGPCTNYRSNSDLRPELIAPASENRNRLIDNPFSEVLKQMVIPTMASRMRIAKRGGQRAVAPLASLSFMLPERTLDDWLSLQKAESPMSRMVLKISLRCSLVILCLTLDSVLLPVLI